MIRCVLDGRDCVLNFCCMAWSWSWGGLLREFCGGVDDWWILDIEDVKFILNLGIDISSFNFLNSGEVVCSALFSVNQKQNDQKWAYVNTRLD